MGMKERHTLSTDYGPLCLIPEASPEFDFIFNQYGNPVWTHCVVSKLINAVNLNDCIDILDT